jgi:hypothetical protein
MSEVISKTTFQAIEMLRVENNQELGSVLRTDFKSEPYILFVFNESSSLLKVDISSTGKTVLSHYDLLGRPMLLPTRSYLEQNFPEIEVLDVSRAERAEALFNRGGFGAYQDVHSDDHEEALSIALRKLASVTTANRVSSTSVTPTYFFRPAAQQSLSEVPILLDPENDKSHHP